RRWRARWRPAQGPLAGDGRGDVRELGEMKLVSLGLGNRKGILIHRGGGIQAFDSVAGESGIDLLHVGGSVGAGLQVDALTLVDEVEVGGGVARIEIDQSVLQ